MTEIFNERQLNKMAETSKRFEHAWRVYSHPKDYSPEEVVKQAKFISDQRDNFIASAKHNPGSAAIYERISMGIFHYRKIHVPPAYKYHPQAN